MCGTALFTGVTMVTAVSFSPSATFVAVSVVNLNLLMENKINSGNNISSIILPFDSKFNGDNAISCYLHC